MRIQGRNLPQRERVLSTIMPMNGSLNASQMRATTKSTATNIGSTRRTSVRYFMKYVLTMAYTRSLPKPPMPKLSFERHVSLFCIFLTPLGLRFRAS